MIFLPYLSELNHVPSLVSVFGWGFVVDEKSTESGKLYYQLIMEVGNSTLDNFIDEASKQPRMREWLASAKLNMFVHIVSAIYFMHRKNLLHLDIKPANILVFRDNNSLRLKLCDLGSSCNAAQGRHSQESSSATTSGWYSAPEVFKSSAKTKACDVWSLGTVAVEMSDIDRNFYQSGLNLPSWDPKATDKNWKSIVCVCDCVGLCLYLCWCL